MAKSKKNSNYVTEKTVAAKEKKAEEKLKAKKAKTIKLWAIWGGSAVAFIALIVVILVLSGAFDYNPHVTHHATITLSDGSSFHIDLYGEDAPKTVNNFIALCEKNYFNNMDLHTFANAMLTMGAEKADDGKFGIVGEFENNGIQNKIPMKKGTLVLARGEGYNSGYGQFFILSKKMPSLEGDYAAFGRLSDPSMIKEILSKCTVGDDGTIISGPKIQSITTHSETEHAH